MAAVNLVFNMTNLYRMAMAGCRLENPIADPLACFGHSLVMAARLAANEGSARWRRLNLGARFATG